MTPHKWHLTLASLLLAAAMLQPLVAETKTSTQVSQANNLSSKDFGILLSVPDHLCRNVNDNQKVSEAGYDFWDRNHKPSIGETDIKEVTVTAKAGTTGSIRSKPPGIPRTTTVC